MRIEITNICELLLKFVHNFVTFWGLWGTGLGGLGYRRFTVRLIDTSNGRLMLRRRSWAHYAVCKAWGTVGYLLFLDYWMNILNVLLWNNHLWLQKGNGLVRCDLLSKMGDVKAQNLCLAIRLHMRLYMRYWLSHRNCLRNVMYLLRWPWPHWQRHHIANWASPLWTPYVSRTLSSLQTWQSWLLFV